MGNDLRRQLGDAAGMSEFLQDLIKEEKTQRAPKPKPKRGNRRPQRRTQAQKAQKNQQTPEEIDQTVENAVAKEKRRLEGKFAELERTLKQDNAHLRRLVSEKRQNANSIIPDDIDEFARLFILAELIGKPPPGLS